MWEDRMDVVGMRRKGGKGWVEGGKGKGWVEGGKVMRKRNEERNEYKERGRKKG